MRLAIRSLGLAVVALLVLAASAAASSPFRYALAARGFRSYFVFNVRPGQTAHGTLEVIATGHGPATILLAPARVGTAAAGGLDFTRTQSSWVQIASTTVRLTPGAHVPVPFTVHVPAGASPGQHFAGVLAVDSRALSARAAGSSAIRIRVVPQLAMTIEVTTPGRLWRALSVGRAAISVSPAGASLQLNLSNPGDELVSGASGHLTIAQAGRRLFASPLTLGPFVPGTQIALRAPWQGMPVAGTYTVTGTLRPAGSARIAFRRVVVFGNAAIRRFRRDTGRAAETSSGVPFWLLLLLGAVVVLAVAFAVAYARLRARVAGSSGRR